MESNQESSDNVRRKDPTREKLTELIDRILISSSLNVLERGKSGGKAVKPGQTRVRSPEEKRRSKRVATSMESNNTSQSPRRQRTSTQVQTQPSGKKAVPNKNSSSLNRLFEDYLDGYLDARAKGPTEGESEARRQAKSRVSSNVSPVPTRTSNLKRGKSPLNH